MSDNDKDEDGWKHFTEEVEVAGNDLVQRVKELIEEGNVRRLRVRSKNDDVVVEVPLTVGAVAGGVVVLAAPALALLGALAGFLAQVRIEVVRDVDSAGPDDQA